MWLGALALIPLGAVVGLLGWVFSRVDSSGTLPSGVSMATLIVPIVLTALPQTRWYGIGMLIGLVVSCAFALIAGAGVCIYLLSHMNSG